MFSLGGSEILVLGILALLLFGNKNLPENMKKMVKGLNEVKKVAHDAQRSWHEIRDDVTRQIMADEAAKTARQELAKVRQALAAPVQGQEPLAREELVAPSLTESSAAPEEPPGGLGVAAGSPLYSDNNGQLSEAAPPSAASADEGHSDNSSIKAGAQAEG